MSFHQIQFGSQIINFELQFSERATLSINVHPDLSVLVKAPENTQLEDIQKRYITAPGGYSTSNVALKSSCLMFPRANTSAVKVTVI